MGMWQHPPFLCIVNLLYKYSIILSINGEEKVINIDDATDIMVTKNYI